MITKVPALSTYTASTNPFYEMTIGDALLAQTAIGADRIWFSPTVGRVDLDPEAFRVFLDRARALEGIPITVHEEQSMLDPAIRRGARPPRGRKSWSNCRGLSEFPSLSSATPGTR
jgi:hypothetical protein